MKFNVKESAVRGANGLIDADATVALFTEQLSSYITNTEAKVAQVASAVSDVFDEHKGVRMNTPALVSFSLSKLGAGPANYSDLEEAVGLYVHAQARTESNPDGLFEITKGKGGGICRVCDKKPKA